jgi:hypothetical protein
LRQGLGRVAQADLELTLHPSPASHVLGL